MKKTVTVFGLISGVVLAIFICMMVPFMKHMDEGSMMTSMFIGYTVQLLAFSMIFFAIKTYRDKQNGGVISFGKAFQIGILISLIGSAFYVITWAIIYNSFLPDFMDTWGAAQINSAIKRGASATEIAKIKQQVADGKEMYSTWWGFAGITLFEIFPTGLLVTLISSFILKRKQNSEVRLA
jgi:predicted ABC-type exoprotein transport system permease subunit